MSRGPFFWNHLSLFLLVTANFGVSIFSVHLAGRSFRPAAIAGGMAWRAAAFAYLTISLLALLIGITLMISLEFDGYATACWKRNAAWVKVRVGMTRREVLDLMGHPADIHFDRYYFYDLHPLGGPVQPSIHFEEDAPVDDSMRVVSKNPPEGAEWLSPEVLDVIWRQIHGAGNFLSLLLLAGVALTSLLPLPLKAGWNGWMIYLPVMTATLALIYESTVSPGWRFDIFFLIPIYFLTGAPWLLRILLLFRR